MAMVHTPTFYTADMVHALPDDGQRYELVWGELLVTPAPTYRHQDLVLRLYRYFAEYCDTYVAAKAMCSPADISWGEDTVIQPDVFVFPRNEGIAAEWSSIKTLLLVAEVLGPSTQRHDRFNKRRLYQERDVSVLWLVDGDNDSVEVWSPHAEFPVIEGKELRWHPDGAAAPLVIALAELFKKQ